MLVCKHVGLWVYVYVSMYGLYACIISLCVCVCNNACLYVQLYMYDIVYMYLGIMAIHIARYKKLAKALKYVRK